MKVAIPDEGRLVREIEAIFWAVESTPPEWYPEMHRLYWILKRADDKKKGANDEH